MKIRSREDSLDNSSTSREKAELDLKELEKENKSDNRRTNIRCSNKD